MAQLLVSTRKGLFEISQRGSEFKIDAVHFLGDPVTLTLWDPTRETLFAALNLGHFGVKFRRKQRAGAWEDLDPPSLAEVPSTEDPTPSVQQIWSLTMDPKGTLWAGTIPAALFRSEDQGATWTLNQALWQEPTRTAWFGGGYDQAGIHTLLVHPNDPDQLTVGISCGGVWHSADGGQSFHPRCQGLRAEYMPPEKQSAPEAQDPHMIAQCQADPATLWMQHHNGIFVTRDYAVTWREIRDVAPSVFGFAVAVHPDDPNTAWFVPAVKDECRVPRDARVVVNRTRDGGSLLKH